MHYSRCFPLQSANDQPLLPLRMVLQTAIPLRLPFPSVSLIIFFENLICLKSLRFSNLKEIRKPSPSCVKACNHEDPR